jgi:tetratricopeptide (TPR) repeat protein
VNADGAALGALGILAALVLSLPASSPAVAQSEEPEAGAEAAAELFVEANQAYEEGSYALAVEGYRSLVAAGVAGPAVLYNLGNALLRDGRLGAAIASYRRAAVQAPREEDLEANLRFARESARDALEPPGPGALRKTLFFWHYTLSWDETLRAAILVQALLFGALSLLLRRRESEPLRWLAGAAAVVLLALVFSLVVRWALPLRVAVVLPAEVEIHSGTDLETVVRFRLHAGTEVQALEVREDWVRISLPDGEQGWLPAEHVELLTDLR